MGLSCSWVAVKGGDRDEILKKFNLVETGEDIFPGERNPGTPVCYFEWPSGWFILVSDDYEWVDRERVFALSQFGLTMGVNYLENVENGYSTALAVEKGVVLWRVAHNGKTAKLETSGNPPEIYADIRDQIMREEEETGYADILDVPAELVKEITGFRVGKGETYFRGLRFTGPDEKLNQKNKPVTLMGALLFLFSLPFRVAIWAVTSPFRRSPAKQTEL